MKRMLALLLAMSATNYAMNGEFPKSESIRGMPGFLSEARIFTPAGRISCAPFSPWEPMIPPATPTPSRTSNTSFSPWGRQVGTPAPAPTLTSIDSRPRRLLGFGSQEDDDTKMDDIDLNSEETTAVKRSQAVSTHQGSDTDSDIAMNEEILPREPLSKRLRK